MRVVSIAFLSAVALLASSQGAVANEACISPVAMSPDITLPNTGIDRTSEVQVIEGYERPFIETFGAPILTIANRKLLVFDEPPLDQWSRLPPKVVTSSDGVTFAYSMVKPALYRLDKGAGQFIREPASDTPGLVRFAHSGWRRQHGDRTSTTGRDGPIFAEIEDGLAMFNDGKLERFSLPRDWRRSGSVPVHVPDVGWFLSVDGKIYFRRFDQTEWHNVSKIRDLRSVYGESPFDIFQVSYQDDTGIIRLMLFDRVMVGRFRPEDAFPKFDYQFSGQVVVHQPTGQVLVWSGEPRTQDNFDRPKKHPGEPGLWEMTPGSPTPVGGFAAKPRMAGRANVSPSTFHRGSGFTIIGHEDGFASFDGSRLHNLPQLGFKAARKAFLFQVGERTILKAYGWLAEIMDNLDMRSISLPVRQPGSFGLTYSPGLGRYFLTCDACSSVYVSDDLATFQPVRGKSEPIVALPGDMPNGKAMIALSKRHAYLIERCGS